MAPRAGRATVAAALWALAAPPAVAAAADQVFRAAIDVVTVDVSVTDDGRPVAGLTAADFEVTDNDAAQRVDAVAIEALPLRLMLVLDVSASTAGPRLTALVAAVDRLTRSLQPGDQAALITFSHQIALGAPMGLDLNVVRATAAQLTATGATALRDAVDLATRLTLDQDARSVMLVFTDGRDTASWLTEDDVIGTVRRTGALIHVVHMGSDPFLGRLVDAAGGRLWPARSDRDLDRLFHEVLAESRSRYRLTYSPTGPQSPGWHEIEVTVKGRRAAVRARPGYFVEDPAGR